MLILDVSTYILELLKLAPTSVVIAEAEVERKDGETPSRDDGNDFDSLGEASGRSAWSLVN